MTAYDQLQTQLRQTPATWLITGVAGFIGSNLLETLLKLDQRVVGLDNFSTGRSANLDQVRDLVSAQQWAAFRLMEDDIEDAATCQRACTGVDYVLHQAALGSVPRSMEEPLLTHASNATGFLHVLIAARDQKAKRLVYASSSAVYGDDPGLPKVEEKIGQPLSPYAATKWMDEIYAGVFGRAYGFGSIGLRYFNVFGPRQDPNGAYAAVIPKWIDSLLAPEPVTINGDGETSRDFCHIANVVQANLLAATTANPAAVNQVFNIAVGDQTTLNQLFNLIQDALLKRGPALKRQTPAYRDFRPGDIRHSVADIGKARALLGYEPGVSVGEGLEMALDWYRSR